MDDAIHSCQIIINTKEIGIEFVVTVALELNKHNSFQSAFSKARLITANFVLSLELNPENVEPRKCSS